MCCESFKFIWRSLEFLTREFGYFLCDFNVESDPRVDSLMSVAIRSLRGTVPTAVPP